MTEKEDVKETQSFFRAEEKEREKENKKINTLIKVTSQPLVESGERSHSSS